jgi:hypothetical protein
LEKNKEEPALASVSGAVTELLHPQPLLDMI